MKNVLTALLNGDGTIAVVLILLVVIAGLIIAIIKLWKDNRDKHKSFSDIASEYTDNLVEMLKESHKHQEITHDALRKIELVLTEMKGKLQ